MPTKDGGHDCSVAYGGLSSEPEPFRFQLLKGTKTNIHGNFRHRPSAETHVCVFMDDNSVQKHPFLGSVERVSSSKSSKNTVILNLEP